MTNCSASYSYDHGGNLTCKLGTGLKIPAGSELIELLERSTFHKLLLLLNVFLDKPLITLSAALRRFSVMPTIARYDKLHPIYVIDKFRCAKKVNSLITK